jgi:fumarate hydratase class II
MMGEAGAYLNEVKETEVGLRESIKVLKQRKTLSTEQLIDILRTATRQAVDGQAVAQEGISWVTQFAERIKIVTNLVDKLKELIQGH